MVNSKDRPLGPRLPPSMPLVEDLPMESDSSWEAWEIRSDLSGSALEGLDVAECQFTGVSLSSVELDRCRIRDSRFVECDLSGGLLECISLNRVEFHRCRLTGAVLSGGVLRDVRFLECQMRGVLLRVAEGTRVEFDSSDLTDADFYGTKLEHAYFFDCDLTDSDFSQAGMRGARLHGSKLERVRGVSSLSGVVVSSAQVLPLATQLLAVMGVEIDDERE